MIRSGYNHAFIHSFIAPQLEMVKRSVRYIHNFICKPSIPLLRQQRLQNRLNIRIRLVPRDAQDLIVSLLHLATISVSEDRHEDIGDQDLWSELALGDAGIGRGLELSGARWDRLQLQLRSDLAGQGEQLVLGGDEVLDVDGAVLGLLEVGEGADDGLADGGEAGGAEEPVAAVPDGGLAGLPVEQEALLETPVEEGAVAHERVGELRVGLGGGLEVLDDGELEAVHGEGGRLGVAQVGAEF